MNYYIIHNNKVNWFNSVDDAWSWIEHNGDKDALEAGAGFVEYSLKSVEHDGFPFPAG